MRIRHPPGRAGRPWLVHRLQIALRGAELLDQKYRALTRERHRLDPLVADARDAWEHASREAERWLARAAVVTGERQLEHLRAAATPPAQVTVSWHTVLGVSCPAEAQVTMVPDAESSAVAAGAVLIRAAQAHRDALAAAVRLAAVEGALRRIDAELRATAVRRNAIERRWIPAHQDALAALELNLDELEREDGSRVRRLLARSSQ